MKNDLGTEENLTKNSLEAMRFQVRDGEILQAIYERDGVLARRQLKDLFWPGKTIRAMEKRLAKLHYRGYIAWPSPLERRTRPIPEPIVWLDWKGIIWVAGQSGISVALPTGSNENQLRKLENSLRDQGVHWLREPRWAQLAHDLQVADFRLCVEKAVKKLPTVSLEEWVCESTFRAKMDIVEYERRDKSGKVKRFKKGVCPDGYFALVDESRRIQGSAARARFLVEVDMATHDNPNFGKEKILPGLAYLLSSDYLNRFGDNSGRWLVVTTGERRMLNLKRQAEAEAGDKGAAAFYFTTFDQIHAESLFFKPIWYRGGDKEKHELFEG